MTCHAWAASAASQFFSGPYPGCGLLTTTADRLHIYPLSAFGRLKAAGCSA